MDWNPSEFRSVEEAARSRAQMDREFGMPPKPYPKTQFGRLVNTQHFRRDTAMNDEFGWGGTTRADLARRWDQ